MLRRRTSTLYRPSSQLPCGKWLATHVRVHGIEDAQAIELGAGPGSGGNAGLMESVGDRTMKLFLSPLFVIDMRTNKLVRAIRALPPITGTPIRISRQHSPPLPHHHISYSHPSQRLDL